MNLKSKIKSILVMALCLIIIGGTISVSANPLPEEGRTGSIIIHKYAMDAMPNPGTPASGIEDESLLPEGVKPLEGVSFKIEKVDDNTLPKDIKGNDTSSIIRDNTFVSKNIITGNGESGTTKGVASIINLPQGIYLVTELDNVGVLEKGFPFLVSIPMAHPTYDVSKPITDSNNPWLYDVHVYPKNVVAGAPSIDKDVTTDGNKEESANIGEDVTWIIKPSIPQDIAEAKKYDIIDILDTRLNYTGNLKVFYIKDSTEVIIDSMYYTASEPVVNNDPKIIGGGELRISFNETGRKYLAERYLEGISKITISFTTIINISAELGTEIPNNVTLDYTNSFGTNTEYTPVEKPEVHTGGVALEKIDASNNSIKLEGAKFKIYPSEKDAKDGTNAIRNPENKTEEWEITSNAEGIAEFKGLRYGTYWIVETVAPQYDSNGDGIITSEDKRYNLLTAPLEVIVNKTSHNNKVVVQNRKFTLPLTGGKGTIVFTVSGLLLMGTAAFIYKKSNNKIVK